MSQANPKWGESTFDKGSGSLPLPLKFQYILKRDPPNEPKWSLINPMNVNEVKCAKIGSSGTKWA